MICGCARASIDGQSVNAQVAQLTKAGAEKIFRETASGACTERAQLRRALDQLEAGDVFILAVWDRATRSMFDGIAIMQRVHACGAAIKVLDKPRLDLTTKIGQRFLAFLSALAEDQRERIIGRAAKSSLIFYKTSAGQITP